MIELIWLTASGGLLVSAAVVWRAGTSGQFQAALVGYELRFPRGLKPEQVTAFVTALSGLTAPRWQRWREARGVVFEVTADARGIGHRLLMPRDLAPVVLSALRAQLPAVRVTQLDAVPVVGSLKAAAQLGLSSASRPLAIDGAGAVTTGILASLQPLPENTQVLLQWVIEPAGATRRLDDERPGGSGWSRWFTGQPAAGRPSRAEPTKAASALFTVTPRIGVQVESTATARNVMGRVLAAFHAANAPGVHLYRRLLPNEVVARSIAGRRLPVVVPGCLFSATELAMLVGIPTGTAAIAGLPMGTSRLLAPSP